jgi:hypothetical protein
MKLLDEIIMEIDTVEIPFQQSRTFLEMLKRKKPYPVTVLKFPGRRSIKNVRFDDEERKFNIGLKVPKIEVESTGRKLTLVGVLPIQREGSIVTCCIDHVGEGES